MHRYQPRNLLITGGAGFIGSHFIRGIINSGYSKIINLDLLTYAGSLKNVVDIDCPNYQFIKGDINDKNLITEILECYNIDTIVHFAAESHVDRSITHPDAFIQTNILGTFNLLDIAQRYWEMKFQLNQSSCRFHHISTDEVYGSLDKQEPAFSESSRYDPSSPYSASKASSDLLVRSYFRTYTLPVTISNCSNNFGPYQHEEKLIPTIIRSCLNERPIPIYGDGSNIRDWLYVEDHCHAVERVITHGELGDTYNIGGNNEKSNLEIANKICQLMDQLYPASQSYLDLITFVEDRKGHDWRYAINADKMARSLNWSANSNFDFCLQKTIIWYCNKHQCNLDETQEA